jgi:hypothetical protein
MFRWMADNSTFHVNGNRSLICRRVDRDHTSEGRSGLMASKWKWWLCLCLAALPLQAQSKIGFDRNDYPGDAQLLALHGPFAFTGYWLNAPPGETSTSWSGKRDIVERSGLGFLLLWNGKRAKEIEAAGDARILGALEGSRAAAMAMKEGFPKHAILFLDQEEGGRLTQPQSDFLFAWTDAVLRAGFGAGVYCSGMPVQEQNGATIRTDDDIRAHAGGRTLHFFLYNDQCPPSPGCVARPAEKFDASTAGKNVDVWQYAQSPRRLQYTSACAKTYAEDGNCYAPGSALPVDYDVASSADPSRAR